MERVLGITSAIPSMFIRRLLLLAGGFAAGVAVLAVQSYRLTVVQGAEHLERAEGRLVLEKWTPTVRGRILDRKGRVLTADRPGFDVMVTYPVITGEWAYEQATRAARKNNPGWGKRTAAERDGLIRAELPVFEAKLEDTWRRLSAVLEISREEINARKDKVREKVQKSVTSTKMRWLQDRIERFGTLNERGEEMTLRDVDRPVSVEQGSYPIATGASEDKLFELRRIESDMPGVEVLESAVRTYPYESMQVMIDTTKYPVPIRRDYSEAMLVEVRGVATHVLGWMRGLQAEDVAKQPRKDPVTGELNRARLMDRDQVGASGIEASLETTLRGLRGVTRQHLDTGENEVEPSVPGKDVRVTVDINLQARVQALMSPASGLGKLQEWHLSPLAEQRPVFPVGTPLNGAAVVLDIATGEVLAMVSMPSFTREQIAEEPEAVWKDELNSPFINRAIAKPYPPGSIIKPVVLVSAVTQGVHTLSHGIECNGHLYPDKPTMYRCWIFKQHHGDTHSAYFNGPLNAPQALTVSCNIYFFTLGRALGVSGVQKWFHDFGIGESFGLGIGAEWPGSVMKKIPINGKVEPPQLQDAIFLGIGQGPIDWTPLHAADAYATLARGGQRLVPRILSDAPVKASDLHLASDAVDAAMEGLLGSVNDMELGSGSRLTAYGERVPMFNHPDLDIRGKTGTAAAPKLFGDLDDDGDKELLREGDHSWFLVLAGPKGKSPKYAISVVMEYAGSGGRVSGPIANQILWALKAEGYL